MQDYRYPNEEQALNIVLKNGVFKALLSAFQSVSASLTSIARVMDHCLVVTEYTQPRLHRLYCKAMKMLDIPYEVPLYLDEGYVLTAKTVGTDGDCVVVISSECLESCTDEQLMAVLGHELGHIAMGHVRNINLFGEIDMLLSQIPKVGMVAAAGVKALLLDWMRYADFTADRAAAIAAGSVMPMLQMIACSMGYEAGKMKLDVRGMLQDTCMLPEKIGLLGKAYIQQIQPTLEAPNGLWRIQELYRWSASWQCRKEWPQLHYSNAYLFELEGEKDAAAAYERGMKTLETDNERGLALLHVAALGNAKAMNELGMAYLLGYNGLTQSPQVGVAYLKRAAQLGNAQALFHLGMLCYTGMDGGKGQDRNMAMRLMRMAASREERAKRFLDEQGEDRLRLSEGTVQALLDAYRAEFPHHSCLLLDAISKKIDNYARAFLYIPPDETICAAEVFFGKMIAVTDCAVYSSCEGEIPLCIPFGEMAKEQLAGKMFYEDREVSIGGRVVYRYVEEETARSMMPLLVLLKKQLTA